MAYNSRSIRASPGSVAWARGDCDGMRRKRREHWPEDNIARQCSSFGGRDGRPTSDDTWADSWQTWQIGWSSGIWVERSASQEARASVAVAGGTRE